MPKHSRKPQVGSIKPSTLVVSDAEESMEDQLEHESPSDLEFASPAKTISSSAAQQTSPLKKKKLDFKMTSPAELSKRSEDKVELEALEVSNVSCATEDEPATAVGETSTTGGSEEEEKRRRKREKRERRERRRLAKAALNNQVPAPETSRDSIVSSKELCGAESIISNDTQMEIVELQEPTDKNASSLMSPETTATQKHRSTNAEHLIDNEKAYEIILRGQAMREYDPHFVEVEGLKIDGIFTYIGCACCRRGEKTIRSKEHANSCAYRFQQDNCFNKKLYYRISITFHLSDVSFQTIGFQNIGMKLFKQSPEDFDALNSQDPEATMALKTEVENKINSHDGELPLLEVHFKRSHYNLFDSEEWDCILDDISNLGSDF